ncbi:MAG: VOC family protein [Gemmatimonadaceae bacterium]|nr:VOC family protein [Gemmatimonadaceae bacterium]
MTDTSHPYAGRFVWYDLMTTDQVAAQKFYTSIAGWGTDEWDMEGTPYRMWTVDGTSIGGMMQLPADQVANNAPPHWLGYIGTPDVAATVAAATSLGATVLMPPTPIPTVGTFAILTDPYSATFAVFTPEGETPGRSGAPSPGDFSWCELATTDIDGALEFYGALFGWTKDSDMDMGSDGIYRMFARDGVMMGGMYNISPKMPIAMSPSWTFYIFVPDIHEAAARVTAGGGTILVPPQPIPGGIIIMANDPQGGLFAAHAMSDS